MVKKNKKPVDPVGEQVKQINDWLVNQGRLTGDPIKIVNGYVRRLKNADVPVSRVRITQRIANPLIAAWGIIWTDNDFKEYEAPKNVLSTKVVRTQKIILEEYEAPRVALSTSAWIGSPFEYVTKNNKPIHKSLVNLKKNDHETYHKIASTGATDYYATVLEYGDKSRQGCSYVTEKKGGFNKNDVRLIEQTRTGLAAAMEPIAMRRTTRSLLEVYLGNDPAKEVVEGTIQRGQHSHAKVAIMFSDLRGFTEKNIKWKEKDFLKALDDYFETVVNAVHKNNGDVLKLIGDGVLAMFHNQNQKECCVNALNAAVDALSGIKNKNEQRRKNKQEIISAGFGLSYGKITYGNIGSLDRLDFTVVGTAVNQASRIQDLCKNTNKQILCGEEVAKNIRKLVSPIGKYKLKGMPNKQQIFAVNYTKT